MSLPGNFFFPNVTRDPRGKGRVLAVLDRYLIKEVLLTFFATVLVLLATVISYRLADYLHKAASGLLAQEAIFLLLGLQAVSFLVILIPPALLLSIMLALGRLYRDSEMTALIACGVGPGAVYRPLFLLAVPIALAMTGLSLYLVPRCMHLQLELQNQARQEAAVSLFRPGVFREIADGKHVIYIGAVEEGGRELRKVFVRSLDDQEAAITTAERGHQEIDPDTEVRYLILLDGHRYQGTPGKSDFYSVQFQRMAVQVDTGPAEQVWVKRQAIPTALIWNTPNLYYRAELHSRFAGPITLLLMAFLAPLVAHTQPREGRYGRLLAAMMIYILYVNLLEVGRSWIANGAVWPALGLWWVHGLMLLLGLGLWSYQYGWPGQWFKRRPAAPAPHEA